MSKYNQPIQSAANSNRVYIYCYYSAKIGAFFQPSKEKQEEFEEYQGKNGVSYRRYFEEISGQLESVYKTTGEYGGNLVLKFRGVHPDPIQEEIFTLSMGLPDSMKKKMSSSTENMILALTKMEPGEVYRLYCYKSEGKNGKMYPNISIKKLLGFDEKGRADTEQFVNWKELEKPVYEYVEDGISGKKEATVETIMPANKKLMSLLDKHKFLSSDDFERHSNSEYSRIKEGELESYKVIDEIPEVTEKFYNKYLSTSKKVDILNGGNNDLPVDENEDIDFEDDDLPF